MTVQSSAKSWASVGVSPVGGLMKGATFYVAWPNSAGGVSVSQRILRSGAASHAMPTMATTQGFILLSQPLPSTTILPTSNIVFTFMRPMVDVDATLGSAAAPILTNDATHFIYGLSSQLGAVARVDDPASSFTKHEVYGAFSLELGAQGFLGANALTDSGDDGAARQHMLKTAHGACMTLAWAGVPPFAIFLARYMKHRLGHLWFKLHVALFVYVVGSLVITGLAVIEVEVASWDAPYIFINTNHGILGTILALALYPMQLILGFVSDKLWSPGRTFIPWWDKMHWWVGRGVTVLAAAVIAMGILEYDGGAAWFGAVFAYLGCWAGIFLIAEVWLGADHHLGEGN
ncbi:hypothetical protein DFJ73DRAFT_368631 [Zopfochytrium polystomum]|nr:hypothetical protein DFJ73DRAFT_368631 [Zopfochytrium polystomum]